MHIVVKNIKSKSYPRGRNYFYVAKSIRGKDGKVRQKLIEYLGTGEDLIKRLGIKTD